MASQALGKYSMAPLAFSKKTSFHLDKNKGWDNWLPAESFYMEICDSKIF